MKKEFVPPPVDLAEEKAFLERRLTELLEQNAAQRRHIHELEERLQARSLKSSLHRFLQRLRR